MLSTLGIEIPNGLEVRLSQIAHLRVIQQLQSQDALVALAPEEHVMVDAEVADQREILVDRLDAVGARIARRGEVRLFAVRIIAPESGW